jgi:predicted histidine transporter YuiF (NhaC family)
LGGTALEMIQESQRVFYFLYGAFFMQNLEQEIKKIHERNKKVEAEKAWETSKERRFLIIIITYAFMCFFMNLIGVEKVFINALVPTF